MVRTQAPLVERMTLVWHDWFATSKAERAAVADAAPERAAAPPRARLVRAARDRGHAGPGDAAVAQRRRNRKDDVNENYARELQELFTLGAGRGYSERDVREMARALTGFRNDWSEGRGPHNFRYDREFHDTRLQARATASAAASTGATRVRLEVRHRKHPSFLVAQAVGLLHPDAAAARHGAGARADVRRARPQRPPAARRDPAPPAPLRPGPPDGQAAGRAGRRDAARRRPRRSTPTAWSWLCDQAGQMLFEPPNVSGWDDTRWLDTATFRARWHMATEICNHGPARRRRGKVPAKPAKLVTRAAAFWAHAAVARHPQRARALRAHRDGDRRTSPGSASPTPS